VGLDSIWGSETPIIEPVFDPPLNLCGGLFYGHGSGSFRGKVYAEIIEAVSGISLYREKIPNSDVVKIADALEGTPFEIAKEYFVKYYGDDKNQEKTDEKNKQAYGDLKRMFRAYADAGATLYGRW
jgi:hypothetical protein